MTVIKRKHKHINKRQLSQQRAESKNNYIKQVEKFCILAGCYDAFRIIPKTELEKIYKLRSLPVKILPAEGNEVPKDIMRKFRKSMNELMPMVNVGITDKDVKINLNTYFTVASIFFEYINDLKGDEYRDAEFVKQLKEKFKSYKDTFNTAYRKLMMCLDVICIDTGDLLKRLYWTTHSFKLAHGDTCGIENIISVHSSLPETIHDNKDSIDRQLLRVSCGFADKGILSVDADRGKLKVANEVNAPPIKVFIQAHALHRMKERLDSLNPFWQHLELIRAVREMKIRHRIDGNFFIEYRLDSITVGYLVADLKDENLIIRTFLLITQNGTPEGDKFSELCGLDKIDKSFLRMDRLSTFISTDMCSNPRLKEIFQFSGCRNLLDLYDNQKIKSKCSSQSKKSNALEIVKYLMLDRNNSKGDEKYFKKNYKFEIDRNGSVAAPW